VNNIYIVIGSRGIVGSQITKRLRSLNKHVVTIAASEIVQRKKIDSLECFRSLANDSSITLAEKEIGLILAHRYREDNIQTVLLNELSITRDFVWGLANLCASLRVVVLGSITGRLIDRKLPEAYHYSKELQKSIVRQSIRIGNLQMNLLELYWFEKYTEEKATPEYKKTMSELRKQLGGDNLPSVESITDFSCALIEMHRPPRGQTIVYDGGLSGYQKE
jgi:hypothetical protein